MQITLAHNIPQDCFVPRNDKPKVNRLWVNYDYFCRVAKNISEINARKFKFRNRWNINLKNEVNLFSVPNTDRLRYGIALDNNVILAQIEQLKKEDREEAERGYAWNEGEKKTHHVYEQMLAAVGEFAQYRAKLAYIYTTLDKEKLTEFAKRWAVWVYIMNNYTRFGNSLEIYHAAYSMLFPDQFSGANGKISFKNFYNKCESDGVEATIIDKRTVTKVKNRRSPVQMAFLQGLYIQRQKVTPAAATKKLIAFCKDANEKPMSGGNVKIIFREFNDNLELYRARYGDTAAQKQAPYASLLPAENPNTQWQIDGWTMPFWGADFQRYTLYLIRDNYSRKVIGYSVAESENTTMILEAMDDAMRNSGYFPGEIISDKHSFHKTKVGARIKGETEKLGAVWTITINAQRNQLAERYNQYMDAICTEFPGYLGKNMTAKGKDARPSPEVMAEYAKTKNFKTFDEIKMIAGYAVVEFNRNKVSKELSATLNMPCEMSPNEIYAAGESIKAFPISEAERVALIKPIEAYKVTRGQINIKIGGRKHEFQLSAALIDRYNNKEIEVTYEDLTEGIYIADINTGEMLGFIEPKRKIHGAIPDQTQADRDLLNKLTGRTKGTATKARKTAQGRIAAGLKANPDAIALINSHALPKDIRQIALQDAEVKKHLAEQGAKINMVPVRKVAAVVLDAPAPVKKKPFAPTGPVKVGKVDINEFLNN